jgi:hypothetical protein
MMQVIATTNPYILMKDHLSKRLDFDSLFDDD